MLNILILNTFRRDLDALKNELKSYSNEELIWQTKQGINNSAGNLALHIIGNLDHFFGAILGKTGYVRQRDLEFSQKGIPLSNILESIENTKKMLEKVLGNLTDDDLYKDYPISFLSKTEKVAYLCIQLSIHLNYHLGQINYHRRLI